MYAKNLKELKLDESKKIGYTYKTLGAGFWALRQKDFRTALQEIVMAVSIKLFITGNRNVIISRQFTAILK